MIAAHAAPPSTINQRPEPPRRLGARARRRAARLETLAKYGIDPDNLYADSLVRGFRKRGGQPGNLNALKHGRRSRVIRHTRKVVGALRNALDDGLAGGHARDVPKGYLRALRWSQDDLASLELAVIQKAAYLRWRIDAFDALREHRRVPAPPAQTLSRRQEALYKLYLEQRRLLSSVLPSAVQPFEQRLTQAAGAARAALDEWILVSPILGPAAAEACDLDVNASRAKINAFLSMPWKDHVAGSDRREDKRTYEATFQIHQ